MFKNIILNKYVNSKEDCSKHKAVSAENCQFQLITEFKSKKKTYTFSLPSPHTQTGHPECADFLLMDSPAVAASLPVVPPLYDYDDDADI